ncbi:hypothetical protein ACFW9N_45840 [Streptomyces sp. NPDC059496]|uniref:hypothetical protein n=1 Tax=Streptomyces sp. NPDC059496 TaxID=3346851 RepID=UPI00367FD8BF
MATTEHAYETMVRSQFNLQKERLRSIFEKAENSPQVVHDSFNTTESYTYSAHLDVVSFFFLESLSASVPTDEGAKYILGASSFNWWPGPPQVLLGPAFFDSNGFAEMNYPIQELVGRGFRYTAFFTGTQSTVTWQGDMGEYFGIFLGSPLGFWPPPWAPDIHVAWGSGTIHAASS